MLTLFSIPKPFRGHIRTIQCNAIQSWCLLRPACEIILFGDEEGTAETAARFGIRHVPEIECNNFGTPLLNSLFDKAQKIASHKLMCYVNADIILMNDFLKAIQRIKRWSILFPDHSFLMVGQRWDLDVQKLLNFYENGWEAMLRDRVALEGEVHRHWGIDYFVFPRGLWRDIPPFAIGRPAWDNWLLYQARRRGVPVIDAIQTVTAVHQNHNYGSGTLKNKDGTWNWNHTEIKENLNLGGGLSHTFNLQDATWLLKPHVLKPAFTTVHLLRRHETLPILYPEDSGLIKIVRFFLSATIFFNKLVPRLHPYRVAKSLRRRIKMLFDSSGPK